MNDLHCRCLPLWACQIFAHRVIFKGMEYIKESSFLFLSLVLSQNEHKSIYYDRIVLIHASYDLANVAIFIIACR